MAELGPEYIQYKDLITNDGITLEFLKWIVENGQFEMFSDEYSDQYIVNLQHKSVFRDHIIDILSPRVSGERFGESVQMRLEHEFELFRVNGPTLVLLSLFIPFSYNSFPSHLYLHSVGGDNDEDDDYCDDFPFYLLHFPLSSSLSNPSLGLLFLRYLHLYIFVMLRLNDE